MKMVIMMTKKEDQKKEIIWNLINAGLAGALVLLGSFTQGVPNIEGIFVAVIAAVIIFVTKIKEYWLKEEAEYCNGKGVMRLL